MSRRGGAMVAYEEPPDPYMDEPDEEYYAPPSGRTGVRDSLAPVDYDQYTVQRTTVQTTQQSGSKFPLILFLLCCCCLVLAGIITGLVLLLQSKDTPAPISAPTSAPVPLVPTISGQPSIGPSASRFVQVPTSSNKPTVSERPSSRPSLVPSLNPTGIPTMSSNPTVTPPFYSVLGTESWDRFGLEWSLDVDDQNKYEFIMEFKHDETLPEGELGYQGNCSKDTSGGSLKSSIYDLKPYVDARKHWNRLPDYFWNATGFQHLSIDWHACGTFPKGFAAPQYQFSFFRVRPEYRAYFMECDRLPQIQLPRPNQQVCRLNPQNSAGGRGFYILPSSVIDRSKTPNMPAGFVTPDSYPAVPFVGLTHYDVANAPDTPENWNSLGMAMSTHDGDLVMWQAQVPYKFVKGPDPQLNSKTATFEETTIQTLPTSYSVDYKGDGVIRFQMSGISDIPKAEFDALKAANPSNIPSAATAIPNPSTCVCITEPPSARPTNIPSISPSQMPTNKLFDTCSFGTPFNQVINCFSASYECNSASIVDCEVDCVEDQCLSSKFEKSLVNCLDATSCNQKDASSSRTTFQSSQVLCQETGSCSTADFLACSCCDGVGCPSVNSDGDPLSSCKTGDVEAWCAQTVASLGGQQCKDLGNPACNDVTI